MHRVPQFFLHFLNREILQLYGTSQSLHSRSICKHALILTRYALLLSDLPLIVPPAALFELEFANNYLTAVLPASRSQLLHFASPTPDIEKYAIKKQREYRDQAPLFARYLAGTSAVTERNIRELQWLPRVRKSASKEISTEWLDQIQIQAGALRTVIESRAKRSARSAGRTEETLAAVPKRLDGRAFIMDNVRQFLPKNLTCREAANVGLLISYGYLRSFLDEYQASILNDTPLGLLDCGLSRRNGDGICQLYSFRQTRALLRTLGLMKVLEDLTTLGVIIELRSESIFQWFRSQVLAELTEPTGRMATALVASHFLPKQVPSKRLGRIAVCDLLYDIYDRIGNVLGTRGSGSTERTLIDTDTRSIVLTPTSYRSGAQMSLWAGTEQMERNVAEDFAEELRNRASIGIITALEKEFAAVEVMLGKTVKWTAPGTGAGRRYAFAEIGSEDHRTQIVALAMVTDVGNNSAAIRATQLQAHCPNVTHMIMCGIAGGIPNPEHTGDSVRLGDVVVSSEFGVIQYDFVKDETSQIEIRHRPRAPSAELIEADKLLRANALQGVKPWEAFLSRGDGIEDGARPRDNVDARGNQIVYPFDRKRVDGLPRIFRGPIASANTLLKNPVRRDALRERFGVIAVEMESSGIADASWVSGKCGYLTVRGICDYCDPEKGDVWQGYAAVSSAAYVRALIESIPTGKGHDETNKLSRVPPSSPSSPSVGSLKKLYRDIAIKGEECLRKGTVDPSEHLINLAQDSRRGLTIVIRPSLRVAKNLESVVNRLTNSCTSLFGYDATRFHITLLSLKTAVENFHAEQFPLDTYETTIEQAVKAFPAPTIQFIGVCPTPNSIVATGFPSNESLELIRDELRRLLKLRGLDHGVDERYAIRGAHLVLARFLRKEADFSRLSVALRELTEIPLGEMVADQCHLVVNDFYFSKDKIRILRSFPLSAVPPIHNLPRRPAWFIGRDRELKLVLETIQLSNSPMILTSGFGGIGKSTLALETAWYFAEVARAEFEFVIWVDLRQYNENYRITLSQVINTIALIIQTDSEIPSVSDLEQKKHLIVRLLAKCRCLLVFDNYESVIADEGQDAELVEFLKMLPFEAANQKGARLIITTRSISTHLRELLGQSYGCDLVLPRLSDADSLEFTKRLTSARSVSLTQAQYGEIGQLTHGLPKYIQVAVDQLAVIPFDDWKKVVQTVPNDIAQDRFYGNLFSASWNRVLSTDTKQLLMALTLFVTEASYEALEATTGLEAERFQRALGQASSAYVERLGEDCYGVHPLTHKVCSSFLKREEHREFRIVSGRNFISYFLSLAQQARAENELHQIQAALGNIVAAVRLAKELHEWKLLTGFQSPLSEFLRTRGFWEEFRVVLDFVRLAWSELGEGDRAAWCLVDDLAWLYLRLEDLDAAERFAKEGLTYFEKISNESGIAQALRHLGKAALLRGEYSDSPDEGQTSQQYFDEAQNFYLKSVALRTRLQERGQDQRERIADMKLDFGRLYWLRGRKYEQVGRTRNLSNVVLIDRARTLYSKAIEVSSEALGVFLEINSARGIAKAWGNLGNAEKEFARSLLASGLLTQAEEHLQLAWDHYSRSLDCASSIHRKDEIAHACWGLAETIELRSYQITDANMRKRLIGEGLQHARRSNELYSALGGPRDIAVTKELASRLEEAHLDMTDSKTA
jgi:nucleoside phosphorylase/tetratricopeptide (TPR) repeat protein